LYVGISKIGIANQTRARSPEQVCTVNFLGNTTLVTAPTIEPLTTAETKTYLRVDPSDEDTLIGNIVKAARIQCEAETKRTLINTSWKLNLPFFPSSTARIYFIHGPLVSITHIKYYSTSGVLTTIDVANYQVETSGQWGSVIPGINQTWPSVQDQKENAVDITYVAGYGTATTNVPESLRVGMLLFCAHLYENRGVVQIGRTVETIPMGVTALWNTESAKESW